MILNIEFESLDLFCAEYGASVQIADVLKVHIVDGLGIADNLKPLFSRRYLHDQWKNIKYDKWEVIDGVLHARVDHRRQEADEWVKYEKKDMASEIIRYEFVGNCWLVFEGVEYAKRTIAEYVSGGQELTGKEIVEKIGTRDWNNSIAEQFILEGVLITAPGPGWMNWRIEAQSFHIEVPGS